MTRIYISSTFSDLQDQRTLVHRALRKMVYHVIAVEDYVATDQRPLEKCLEDVHQSDIYVGLLAWRYGFIPSGHVHSITELELRCAKRYAKPCLIFMLRDEAPWPDHHRDPDDSQVRRLRNELALAKLAGLFGDDQELVTEVLSAVHTLVKRLDNSALLFAHLRAGDPACATDAIAEIVRDFPRHEDYLWRLMYQRQLGNPEAPNVATILALRIAETGEVNALVRRLLVGLNDNDGLNFAVVQTMFHFLSSRFAAELSQILDQELPRVASDSRVHLLLLLTEKATAILWGRYKQRKNATDLILARDALSQAISYNPKIAEALLHLGIITAILGDLDGADAYLRRSIEHSSVPQMSLSIESMRAMLRSDPARFRVTIESFYHQPG